jgi:hypothetical protein
MKTIYELQQEAIRLRQVKEVDSISPEETFGLHADTLAYLADMEQNAEGLGIHKVYKSFAAMNADSSAPVGTNGKPLRFGQLVAIYDKDNQSQTENGNIYAFQKGAEAGWLLMGNLNSIGEDSSTIAEIKEKANTASTDASNALSKAEAANRTAEAATRTAEAANRTAEANKTALTTVTSDLATLKEKVNEIPATITKFVNMSEAAYEALETKEADTYYMLTEE